MKVGKECDGRNSVRSHLKRRPSLGRNGQGFFEPLPNGLFLFRLWVADFYHLRHVIDG